MAPRGPRVTRDPLPAWGGSRKGPPRCSSGGSPPRAASVADAAAAASSDVAKVPVAQSSSGSSSGYFSPRDEVSATSFQPPCMSTPSGCSPQQPELATPTYVAAAAVADADGADSSPGNPSAALPSSLPEGEEPLLSSALQTEANADGEDAAVIASSGDSSAAIPSLSPVDEDEDEGPLSPAAQKEAALLILYHLDLAREKRMLSARELELYDDLKSQLPDIEAEIRELNGNEVDGAVITSSSNLSAALTSSFEEEDEEYLSPAFFKEVAFLILSHFDLARQKRMLSAGELQFYDELLSLLPGLEARIRELNANGEDGIVIASSSNTSPALSCSLEEEEEEEEEEEAEEEEEEVECSLEEEEEVEPLLSRAVQKEIALLVLSHLDLAREKRMLLAGELRFRDKLLSLLARFEAASAAEIRVLRALNAIAASNDSEDLIFQQHAPSAALGGTNEAEDEEPLSPAAQKEAALLILYHIDLAREEGILSSGWLELYDELLSLLPGIEAQIRELNGNGADGVVIASSSNLYAALASSFNEEEEEESLSPAFIKEVTFLILSHLDLAREKRMLSAGELQFYDELLSLLPGLEAEIRELNANGEDGVVIASSSNTSPALSCSLEAEEAKEEEKEEPLSRAAQKEIALLVLSHLDLVREKRMLSAGELGFRNMLLSRLPRLEAEIRLLKVLNATAPSISSEDLICQPHAPAAALGGTDEDHEVPSPPVLGASTTIKISADLQLGNVAVTNAELSTPGPEATTPSGHESSAELEPAIEDDEITEALYGHSCRRRLPIFRDMCPE